MSNVLVIYGSPKDQEVSASGRLASAFVAAYKAANPQDEIVEVIPSELGKLELTKTIFAGAPVESDQAIFAERAEVLAQIKAADKIIIASPMWDYSLPGSLKSYLDACCVSGETFRYLTEPKEDGTIQEGLLTAKALFIQTMGGMHKGTEDDVSYLQVSKILQFLGIKDLAYVAAQAVDMPKMSTYDASLKELTELAISF